MGEAYADPASWIAMAIQLSGKNFDSGRLLTALKKAAMIAELPPESIHFEISSSHRLSIKAHHSHIDGWGLGNLLSTAFKYYDQPFEASSLPLAKLYERKKSEEISALEQYGSTLGDRLLDYKDPLESIPLQRLATRTVLQFSAENTKRLRELAKANKTTLFGFLLAKTHQLLSKKLGAQDLVFWVPFGNRSNQEEMGAFGTCVHLHPIRARERDLQKLIAEIQNQMITISTLGKVSEQDLNLKPQISINMEPHIPMPALKDGVQVEIVPEPITHGELPVIINFMSHPEQLRAELDIGNDFQERYSFDPLTFESELLK